MCICKITKRDGQVVEFDQEKIEQAILKAFESVDGERTAYALEKAHTISEYIKENGKNELTVEEIQDMVEKGLMASKRKDVAKAYIEYRLERTRIRERKADWMQLIAEKIKASNVLNQNANVDEASFRGRKGEAPNELMKKIALDYCISKKARDNHLNNMIYIHDLDNYATGVTNCLTIPFDDLLAKGFKARQVDIRPANSLSTALQLVAVIFQITSLSLFGGVAAGHLDWTLVPYIRKSFYGHYKDELEYWTDEKIDIEKPEEVSFDCKTIYNNPRVYEKAFAMTKKEVEQGCEGLLHNLEFGRTYRNVSLDVA